MDVKIEKNIPMVSKRESGLPFGDMEVGDSFRAPMSSSELRNKVTYYSHQNPGKKFSIRKDDDGARIWRIE